MGKLGSILISLMLAFLLSLTACGSGRGDTSQPQPAAPSASAPSVPNGSSTLKGWALLAVNTVTTEAAPSQVNHNDYLQGSHANFKCNDCHSIQQTDSATGLTSYVDRSKICVYCHPLSKYSSLMTDADHVALNAGDHCNGCHNSASGLSGSAIPGWRWSSTSPRTRVQSALWHKDVQGVCANCHTPSQITNYPASHFTTGCENCHSYGTGSWKGSGHPSVTTGCATCHSGKAHTLAGTSVTPGSMFTGTDCSTCHQASVTGGYLDWKGAPQTGFHANITGACTNCHVPTSIPTYPSGHYTTGCESCHTYNNGSWKGATGHPNVKTSCNTTGCHAAHTHATVSSNTVAASQTFAPNSCELCHAASITGGFVNWLGATHWATKTGCDTCHKHHKSKCESCHNSAITGGYKKWD